MADLEEWIAEMLAKAAPVRKASAVGRWINPKKQANAMKITENDNERQMSRLIASKPFTFRFGRIVERNSTEAVGKDLFEIVF